MLKQTLKSKPADCHPDKPVQARGLCKNCYDKWLKEHNPNYLERQRINHKKWVELHRERMKQYKENYRLKQDPIYNHVKKLRHYHMTVEDYDSLLKSQNGKCAICQKQPTKNRLAIDHCHKTGEIRGLLCFRCNFGLSYFSEHPDILYNAYKYLTNCKRKKYELPPKDIKEYQKHQARTKEISSEEKVLISSLSDQGLTISELCKRFPEYSKSAIQRARHIKKCV